MTRGSGFRVDQGFRMRGLGPPKPEQNPRLRRAKAMGPNVGGLNYPHWFGGLGFRGLGVECLGHVQVGSCQPYRRSIYTLNSPPVVSFTSYSIYCPATMF